MANVLYDEGRNAFLQGSINWVAHNIKQQYVNLAGVASPYIFNASLDKFFASVPTSARVNTSASLAGKTATAGIADANDTLSTAVSGPTIGAIILFRKANAAAATADEDPLIAYIDTATGMPVQPNGGDITTQWDGTTNRIFKL